jgi:hypothetical protein
MKGEQNNHQIVVVLCYAFHKWVYGLGRVAIIFRHMLMDSRAMIGVLKVLVRSCALAVYGCTMPKLTKKEA